MTHEIDFNNVIGQLRTYHQQTTTDDTISAHHKSEAAYQMVSLLLGIQRFFNSNDFDEEYILEKLITMQSIINAYVHDRRLNLQNWSRVV